MTSPELQRGLGKSTVPSGQRRVAEVQILFILPADVEMFPICHSCSLAAQDRVVVCISHPIKCTLMAQKE